MVVSVPRDVVEGGYASFRWHARGQIIFAHLRIWLAAYGQSVRVPMSVIHFLCI